MRRLFFLALCVILALSACTSTKPEKKEFIDPFQESTHTEIKQMEITQIIDFPKNPSEILQNIKFAIDHQLLLKKNFYEKENLKRVFSAQKISTKNYENDDLVYELTSFNETLVKKDPKIVVDPVVVITVKRAASYCFPYVGIEILTIGDSRSNYDDVVAVFGDAIVEESFYAPQNPSPEQMRHPQPVPNRGSITHPFGSKNLFWKNKTELVRSEIKAEVSGNGLVEFISFDVWEK